MLVCSKSGINMHQHRTSNGQWINIDRLETSHLINIINYKVKCGDLNGVVPYMAELLARQNANNKPFVNSLVIIRDNFNNVEYVNENDDEADYYCSL